MLDNIASFWRDLNRHPIALFWLIAFAVCAGLNATMGFEVGGGGVHGVFFAGAFVSIAVLGAYAAGAQEAATGAKRAGLWVLVAMQLCLGQWAGWQTLGLTLSRGAGALESKATSRGTLAEDVKRLRDERSQLMTPRPPRPVATIEAAAELECSIRKGGVGDKCTLLREELGKAKRVLEIDAALPGLVAKLAAGEQLKDAAAAYAVPQSFGTFVASWVSGEPRQASADDVRFWLAVFVTLLLEFVATLGPWLLGIGHGARAPVAAAAGWDFGPPRLGYDGPIGEPAPAPLLPVAGSFSGVAATRAPAVHVTPLSPSPARPPGSAPEEPPPAATVPLSSLRRAATSLPPPTPEAPSRPVDRQRMQEITDHLLVFRAACLDERPGQVVSADQMWTRYAAWAGQRAINRRAFETLLAEVAGLDLVDLGGVPQYRGIALKQGGQLAAVS